MSGSEAKDGPDALQCFLFGNIAGDKVEADYLDEDAREALANLQPGKLGDAVLRLEDFDEGGPSTKPAEDDAVVVSADAVDYQDEEDLADDRDGSGSAEALAAARSLPPGWKPLPAGGASGSLLADEDDYDEPEAGKGESNTATVAAGGKLLPPAALMGPPGQKSVGAPAALAASAKAAAPAGSQHESAAAAAAARLAAMREKQAAMAELAQQMFIPLLALDQPHRPTPGQAAAAAAAAPPLPEHIIHFADMFPPPVERFADKAAPPPSPGRVAAAVSRLSRLRGSGRLVLARDEGDLAGLLPPDGVAAVHAAAAADEAAAAEEAEWQKQQEEARKAAVAATAAHATAPPAAAAEAAAATADVPAPTAAAAPPAGGSEADDTPGARSAAAAAPLGDAAAAAREHALEQRLERLSLVASRASKMMADRDSGSGGSADTTCGAALLGEEAEVRGEQQQAAAAGGSVDEVIADAPLAAPKLVVWRPTAGGVEPLGSTQRPQTLSLHPFTLRLGAPAAGAQHEPLLPLPHVPPAEAALDDADIAEWEAAAEALVAASPSGGAAATTPWLPGAAPLLLDMNDPRQVFAADKPEQYAGARALVISTAGTLRLDDPAKRRAALNISNDAAYMRGLGGGRAGGAAAGVGPSGTSMPTRNTRPANSLSTFPLPLLDAELLSLHRPRAAWHPAALAQQVAAFAVAEQQLQKQLGIAPSGGGKAGKKAARGGNGSGAAAPVRVMFATMTGMQEHVLLADASLPLRELWQQVASKLAPPPAHAAGTAAAAGAMPSTVQLWYAYPPTSAPGGGARDEHPGGGSSSSSSSMMPRLEPASLDEPLPAPFTAPPPPPPPQLASPGADGDATAAPAPPPPPPPFILVTCPVLQRLMSRRLSNLPAVWPANAFEKKRDLGPQDAHVLLLEYVEEVPPCLGRPGMGVRLTTYVARRPDGSEPARPALSDWQLGLLSVLGPEDESPFLGNLAPGCHQTAVEAGGLYRAVAAPHDPAPSDFLLWRTPGGVLYVREVTGCITVGPQQPAGRVPAPGSAQYTEVQEKRIAVLAIRLLQARRDASKKKAAAAAQEAAAAAAAVGQPAPPPPPVVPPSLHIKRDLLPFFPNLSAEHIARRLESREVGCTPSPDAAGRHVLRPDTVLPSELKTKEILRPELLARVECGAAAAMRLRYSLGLSRGAQFWAHVSLEKLRLALEQLPPQWGERAAAAGAMLEWLLLSAPWAVTDAFVSAQREAKGMLAVVGPGGEEGSVALAAPGAQTAHGRGGWLAYAKEAVKRSPDGFTVFAGGRGRGRGRGRGAGAGGGRGGPGGRAGRGGPITGTDSDLRKLRFEEAGELLLKFGLSHEDIKSFTTRWDRIKAVRRLSTATAADNMVGAHDLSDTAARYARTNRISIAEQIKRQNEFLQRVHEAQVAAVKRQPPRLDLPAVPAASVKQLLGRKAVPAADATGSSAADAEDEEAAQLAEMARLGLITSASGVLAAAGGGQQKQEARLGDRRIRRTITVTSITADGTASQISVTLFITDREKIAALNQLVSGKETGNFGVRTIDETCSRRPAAGAAAAAAGGAIEGAGVGGAGRKGFGRGRPPASAAPPAERVPRPPPAPRPPPTGRSSRTAITAVSPKVATPLSPRRPRGSVHYDAMEADEEAERDPELQAMRRMAERGPRGTRGARAVITSAGSGGGGSTRRGRSRRGAEDDDNEEEDFEEDDELEEDDNDQEYEEEPEEDEDEEDDDDDEYRGKGEPKYKPRKSLKRSGGAVDDDDDFKPRAAGRPPPLKRRREDARTAAAAAYGGGGAVVDAAAAAEAAAADAVARSYKFFNNQLKDLVKSVMASFKQAEWFKLQVAKSNTADYNKFVPPEKEMWLEKIVKRAGSKKGYARLDDFLTDVRQIHTNAVAYNTLGRGKQAFPGIIDCAAELVARVTREAEDRGLRDMLQRVLVEQQAAAGLAEQQAAAWLADGSAVHGHVVGCSNDACGKWRWVCCYTDAEFRRFEGDGSEDWFCHYVSGLDCSVPELYRQCQACTKRRLVDQAIAASADRQGGFMCNMRLHTDCSTPLDE